MPLRRARIHTQSKLGLMRPINCSFCRRILKGTLRTVLQPGNTSENSTDKASSWPWFDFIRQMSSSYLTKEMANIVRRLGSSTSTRQIRWNTLIKPWRLRHKLGTDRVPRSLGPTYWRHCSGSGSSSVFSADLHSISFRPCSKMECLRWISLI